MTVRELYEWAEKHNALDCNIGLDFYDDDTERYLISDICDLSLLEFDGMSVIELKNHN